MTAHCPLVLSPAAPSLAQLRVCPPMFKQNKPVGLSVQAGPTSLGSPIVFRDTSEKSVGGNDNTRTAASGKRPLPLQFDIEIPSKRTRRTSVELAHAAGATARHTTSPQHAVVQRPMHTITTGCALPI